MPNNQNPNFNQSNPYGFFNAPNKFPTQQQMMNPQLFQNQQGYRWFLFCFIFKKQCLKIYVPVLIEHSYKKYKLLFNYTFIKVFEIYNKLLILSSKFD